MTEPDFDQAFADWAARAERAAPELTPSEDVLRRLRERQRGRRWSGAVALLAAAAALVGVALVLQIVLGGDRPEHVRLVSWQVEDSIAVEGATLRQPGRRGGPKMAAAFAQLVLQHHRPGTGAIRGVDLLRAATGPLSLAPGDRYRFGIQVIGERHVVVFQLGGSAGVERLFPSPAHSPAANPLRSTLALHVPAEPDWFELRRDAAEVETVYAVASPAPQPELVELLDRAERERGSSARAEIVDRLRGLLEELRGDGVAVVSVELR